MFRVSGITLDFGGVSALTDVSFEVPTATVCALIGPNGAGKTSMLNVITQLYRPSAGSVEFEGRNLLRGRRSGLASSGVSRTFQNVALFPGLNVLDNVMIGTHSRTRGGFVGCMLRLPAVVLSERTAQVTARSWLDRLGIGDLADEPVTSLPFGTAKRVELARAMAAEPRVVLLDEPAAGLTHSEVDELVTTLREIRRETEVTMILVEHHMRMVMSMSDTVVALNFGKVMAAGTPDEVASNPAVVEAYLGANA